MARFAIVASGKVVNLIVAANAQALPGVTLFAAPDSVGIGDNHDGATFTRPPTVVVVPQVVSMRQAREALIDAGLHDQVDALIAAMPAGPGRAKTKNWWERSATVERSHRVVMQLAPGLGLDEAGLDALFVQAAQL